MLAGDHAKYRHIRTNKRAWSQTEATGMDSLKDDSIKGAPEIYISEDSVLISANNALQNITVTITDTLYTDDLILSQHYDLIQTGMVERLDITRLPDGIYKITLSKAISGFYLFGYFAKGEQYEQEAETLDIPTLTANDKLKDIIHDIKGYRVSLSNIHKGGFYILDGKKYICR